MRLLGCFHGQRAIESVRATGALTLILLLFCAWCSHASAASLSHRHEGTFRPSDVSGIPSRILQAIAVDESGGPSDGSVYVADVAEPNSNAPFSTVYKFTEDGFHTGLSFSGSETPDGSFSFYDTAVSLVSAHGGLAVDGSAGPNSGDIYVADISHGVVNRFDESGAFVCQITGTATPSPSECNGTAGSETPAGRLVPTAVAVDPATGTLYVADHANGVIVKFASSGAYLGQIADPHISGQGSFNQPSSLALDSTGAIYLVNRNIFNGQDAVKFDPDGSFAAVFNAQEPVAVAIDRAADRVLLSRGGPGFLFGGKRELAELDPLGAPIHIFVTSSSLPYYFGIAVDSSTGRVYAGNSGSIDIYSPDTEAPRASADPPSFVEETTATLSGEVDPDAAGDVISCRFEYWIEGSAPTVGNRHSAPCAPATPYTAPTSVSVELTALEPSSTYRFRLAARNGGVAPYARGVDGRSEEGSFTTYGPPTIHEQAATEIERHAATLRAKVNPHTFESEYRFEYVDAESFDSQGGFDGPATKSTPFSEIGDGEKPRAVAHSVSGLVVGTSYRFRAVARNERGTTYSDPQNFTTVPVATIGPPWVYARIVDATVETKIDPLGLDSQCHAQYVTEERFEGSGFKGALEAPCRSELDAASGESLVKADLAGLEIDTAYRFRFVAENESGSLPGPDASFTTFGFKRFSVEVLDESGGDFTQAGGHPFKTVNRYEFNHTLVPSLDSLEASINGLLKDMLTESPEGRVADTDATERCPGYMADEEACPPETQIGTMEVSYYRGRKIETKLKPIFNIVTPEGVLSRYASVDPYTRTDGRLLVGGDYKILSGNRNITEEARPISVVATMWGVPADPRHDSERSCNGSSLPGSSSPPCPSEAEPEPFLRNPTSCGEEPLITKAQINSWESPEDFSHAEALTSAMTGCEKLAFEPTIELQPTTNLADSPTGLDFNIHVPQDLDPYGVSVADLKDTAFEMPEGLIINPSVAHGLEGCTEEEVQMEGEDPARCPDASKVGSAEINTPLLDHPLKGAIHVAEPYENEFGSLFAIYITFHDRRSGVVIKLAGEIQADGGVGQLKSTFSENPQLAFEDFRLKFFAGPRAVLKTPPTCGTFTTTATLTPWSHPHSGAQAQDSDSFQITKGPNGAPCPTKETEAPNQPSFQAGTVSPIAGAHTPFVMNLKREDGSQRFASLSILPPPGLVGKLAGTPYCPDASIQEARSKKGRAEKASPSCPSASRVGQVTIAAGSGPAPFHVSGDAYLAGPHQGSPLSLVVMVPALGGPYDLGTIVVRAGLSLGLETADLSVKTDSLPTILEGVSLNVRSISVQLDKDDFILNPTSCDPMSVSGELISTLDQRISLSNRFQLANCGRLGFKPKLKISVLGKTRRRAHPSLKAVLTMPKARGANIESARVEMPPSFFLDSDRIEGVCTREQFSRRECPRDSIYGYAKVHSPLLDEPLRGPVRMRSSNQRLPNLVADLDGQVRIALPSSVGSVSKGLGILTTVRNVPDVPVSRVELRMFGGKRGLLQNASDLCKAPQRVRISFVGHNGKRRGYRGVVGRRCGRR